MNVKLLIIWILCALLLGSCCPCKSIRTTTKHQQISIKAESRKYAGAKYKSYRDAGIKKPESCRLAFIDVGLWLRGTRNYNRIHKIERGSKIRFMYKLN